MPESKESFFMGHTLLSNKIPMVAKASDIEDILSDEPMAIESFGLFHTSTPDFNKYYPDVKASDLAPADDEFAFPIFRALSKILVNKFGPVDFGKGDVLKDSMSKLVGQAVMTNHDAIVGNEVGSVFETFWQGKKTYEGVEVPPGINARFKLDGKANPKLVRGIMMDPPSVHSVSVTVRFEWEQSHKKMDRSEFFGRLGTFDEEGKLVRRVVTRIIAYDEISLVTHGADPYAQKIEDEKIVNPKYAESNAMSFSEQQFKEMGHFLDWKNYTTEKIQLTADPTILKDNINKLNNKSKAMNKELKKLLISKLGLAADATDVVVFAAMNEESISLDAFTPAESTDAQVLKLTGELRTANEELTALKLKYPEDSVLLSAEDIAALAKGKLDEAALEKVKTSTRNEALRLYHVSVGGADKAQDAIVAMIAEANLDTASALVLQYGTTAEESFEAECPNCKTIVTRASTANLDTGVMGADGKPIKKEATPATPKSNQEVMANLSKSSNHASGIHGVQPTEESN